MAERIRKHMLEDGVKFVKQEQFFATWIKRFSAIPLKFEQLKPPSGSEPGLVRVTAQRTLEDGTKEEFTDEFNTVIIKTCTTLMFQVLLAIGRDAKTAELGLDKIGVQTTNSGKLIGLREQSASMPHIYAVGDVLEGVPELTPVAIQAGKVLMRRIFTGNMELVRMV